MYSFWFNSSWLCCFHVVALLFLHSIAQTCGLQCGGVFFHIKPWRLCLHGKPRASLNLRPFWDPLRTGAEFIFGSLSKSLSLFPVFTESHDYLNHIYTVTITVRPLTWKSLCVCVWCGVMSHSRVEFSFILVTLVNKLDSIHSPLPSNNNRLDARDGSHLLIRETNTKSCKKL